MADTEEYFPRGGKKPTTTYFKQNENFLGGAQKGERKKKKLKRKTEDDDGYLSEDLVQEVDQSYKICGIGLNYKVVKEGQLFLGRVNQVKETLVRVRLPCRMCGVVMACHISEAYTKMLEAYVNDQIDEVQELKEMFRLGQYVVVKVLEVQTSKLMLSMMPQHVNSTRTQADLHKGALLQAAVSSVEDHGYVMDIGIPGTRAFLPKDSANPEIQFYTGSLTWVAIKSLSQESGVITLSNSLEVLQKALQRKPAALLPGTALEFTVDKPLDNGIEGHVLDNTTAYIQRNQVDTGKGKKPALGHKIRARLLYVVPPKNIPFMTMRNIFETTYPDLTQEQKFKDGDIIKDAQVLKVVGRTVHLKLGEGSVGLLSLRRIAVHEDFTDEQVLLNSYPIGSTHEVRVLCYNLCDYVYSVTDEPAALAEKYFNTSQLHVGDMVDATVTAITDKYLFVTVGRVKGSVPQLHMSETGIFDDPKKASNSKLTKKKFKVGQVVKARVLALNPEKQFLYLTLKPSLLDPELEILQSLDQAAVGKAYTGVIACIKDYLLVSFFNSVTAFVPKRWVCAEPLDNLSDAFHRGQIVKCTIINVNPETKKMCGSLTKAPFKVIENYVRPTKRKFKDRECDAEKQKPDDSETIKQDENEQKDISNSEMNKIDSDEIQEPKKKKKKKNNKVTEEEIDGSNENIETGETNRKKKKKNKIINVDNSTNNADTEINGTTTIKDGKKKKDKKLKKQEVEQKEDSESDPIETDICDDIDQVLTPQNWSFVDLTDCLTAKQYKKRVVALIKCIDERTKRLESIDKNIGNMEEKGLNAKNKKYHTAMHTEKLVIQKQTEKLSEVLKIAQEKLKEFGIEIQKDSKKKEKSVATTSDEIKVEVKEDVDKLKEMKLDIDSLQPVVKVPSAKDFWSLDTDVITDKIKIKESSSSEEEEQEKPKKKRKKLTVAEKASKAREEEERIREMEKRAIESENAPRSSDQFERALLAQPNCSQLWIAYMAFHLQATEIEKARAVGRKALHTINFREEGEKLNVWLALLNLEHRFGTKETQQKTIEDALQMNEPYEIHSKLLDILVETSKPQELVSLVELMLRKYRGRAPVYAACGLACFSAGLTDKARQVMQKGIAALEKKEHVSLLVRFAQLERSHGDRERSEALFEQVLAVYPQRVDVCSAYVDLLIKAKDVDHVRQVMERMTSLQLPARKMKVLYKKWIEAEEKIGDAAHADSARQLAMKFINKAKF
ncbi:rRNA biogenesis protein RRP5 [Maniola hyperantus]|uniref:rRNA biogenesis protein RRP5 n=1 Tax=Aphantopus hyperantus TaxID=2795564 RepID=UPI0015690FDC|nr:protein RRP5 homolog [Maniola hyperantus]